MRLTPAAVALCGAIQLHIDGSVALDEEESAALSPALVRLVRLHASSKDGGEIDSGTNATFTQMLATLQVRMAESMHVNSIRFKTGVNLFLRQDFVSASSCSSSRFHAILLKQKLVECLDDIGSISLRAVPLQWLSLRPFGEPCHTSSEVVLLQH